MFSYKQSENPEESSVYTADEVLCIFGKKYQQYSITEIIRVLDAVTNDNSFQIIYKSLRCIYIKQSSDWYIRFEIDITELDLILKYITQVEVLSDDDALDKVFTAPNLKVIAFHEIWYDEYLNDENSDDENLDQGLHVVLGEISFPFILNIIPPMYKLTILSSLDPRLFPDIISKLQEWTTLKVLVIKNYYTLDKYVLESIRAMTEFQKIELQCK